MAKIPYRPEIDGLRAVSVIGVILFHFAPNLLPGGFMGVDVFFVISGYLISKIILASHESGDLWLRSFWYRRLQRIFPALVVMVITVLFSVCLIGVPSLVAQTGKQAVAVSAFFSNYRMLSVAGNYWGTSADYTLLLHTWSLAVEEQFYFIYPLFLGLAFHFTKLKTVRNALLVVSVLSLFWCIHQTSINQASAFYLLSSRAWELLAGALIAFYGHDATSFVSEKVAASLANVGFILILGGFVFLPSGTSFPGVIALIPVLGASLYIQYSWARGLSSKLLSTSPALLIGKASYSLYLWHWPMLVLGLFYAKFYEVDNLRTVGIIAGICIGFASYKWVEPIGRSTYFLKKFVPFTAALLIVAAGSTAFLDLKVYPEKYKKDWRGGDFDALVNRDTPLMLRAFRGLNSGDIQWPHLKNGDTKVPAVILLGDSHALTIANQLSLQVKKSDRSLAVCAVGGWPLAPTLNSRHLLDPVRKLFYEKRIELIKQAQPELIIISARWENVKGPDGLNAVRTLIEQLNALSPRSKIIVVGQPPVLNYAPNSGIYADEWMNWRHRMQQDATNLPALVSSSMLESHSFLQKLSVENKNVRLVPVDTLFPVTNGRVDAVKGGELLYYDGDHLSDSGAQIVVAKLAPIIRQILNNE